MMRTTDFFALAGIDLVVCAVWLCFLHRASAPGARASMRVIGAVVVVFFVLWIPLGSSGSAKLPVLGYLRGFFSDFSTTSLVLASLAIGRRLTGAAPIARREHAGLFGAICVASLVLYPTALGWGNWDAYRLGWYSPLLGATLAAVALAGVVAGVRLVPLAVAAAVFTWAAGAMESGNLWDHLLDPWLALLALYQCGKLTWRVLSARPIPPAPVVSK